MIVTLKQYSSRIIRLLALLLVLPLLIWSGMGLSASLLAAGPETAMLRWECTGKVDDQARWKAYVSNLELALKLDPRNVGIMRQLAKMYEWRTVSVAPWDESVQAERESSIEWYREVVSHRPIWAMGWAELANMKVRSMELDNEALDGIEKALELGKWQKDVQSKTIWLSVGIWDSIPGNLRVKVKENLKRLLHKELRISDVALYSIRFDWLDELETVVSSPEDLALIDEYRENKNKIRELWSKMAKTRPEHCAHVV